MPDDGEAVLVDIGAAGKQIEPGGEAGDLAFDRRDIAVSPGRILEPREPSLRQEADDASTGELARLVEELVPVAERLLREPVPQDDAGERVRWRRVVVRSHQPGRNTIGVGDVLDGRHQRCPRPSRSRSMALSMRRCRVSGVFASSMPSTNQRFSL